MIRTDFPKFIIVDVTYGANGYFESSQYVDCPKECIMARYVAVTRSPFGPDQRIAIPYENDGMAQVRL